MNSSNLETLFLRVVKTDGRSTVRLFEATPTPLEEKNLGKLFAVIELDSFNENNEHIIDLLLSQITDAYYASEQFEIEAAFEHALHRLNDQITTIVSELGEDWLKKCNAIFGVVHGPHVVFTHSGATLGLLSVKKQLIDIIEPDSRIAELNPLKFFGNVISGQFPNNGSVFFGTDAMMDYLSRETVRRIIESEKSIDAITEFQNLLSVDTHDRNFVGIYMRRTERKKSPSYTATSIEVSPAEKSPTHTTSEDISPGSSLQHTADSMSSLMNKEQETAELLTSSVWPTLKKSLLTYAQTIVGGSTVEENSLQEQKTANSYQPTSTTQQQREQVAKTRNTNTISNKTIGTQATNIAKQFGIFVASGIGILSQGIAKMWDYVLYSIHRARGKQPTASYGANTNRSRRIGTSNFGMNTVRLFIVDRLTAGLRWFGKLTLLQKIFAVLALTVFVVFSQSVVTKGLSNTASTSTEDYAQIMNQIDVKINEGKAAEIVNGDSRTKYAEAKALLATIPKESKIYKERGAEVESIISSELQKSNKISDLGELQPVIDYGSINPALRVKHMILLGASLYAFDANNGSVYRGNLENNEVTTTITATGDVAYLAASKASPGTGLVLRENVVSTFNPVAETMTNANLSFNTTPQSIVDVTVFGNRVYTLDTALNQIIRNRKNDEVFQGGENWLTDSSASVRDGVAMAIDGAVYVLNTNGSVTKFEGGKKANFTLATIDPLLTNGTNIATDENTTNLYIADRDNRRVIVFTKTGELVNQYTSSSFEGMTDLIVDEPNKKIYVLTETGKVYQITIQ